MRLKPKTSFEIYNKSTAATIVAEIENLSDSTYKPVVPKTKLKFTKKTLIADDYLSY